MKRFLWWLAAPFILAGILWGVWFLAAMAWSGGEWVATHEFLVLGQRWFFPGGADLLHATAPGYLLLIAWAMLGAAVATDHDFEDNNPYVVTAAVVVCLACGVQVVRGINDNAKDEGRGYADATVFMVRDPAHAPSFIADLTRESDGGTGRCELVGRHDVTGCVSRGDLPTDWEPRVVSIAGATFQMKTNSPSAGNTDLRDDTVTYLYRGAGDVRVSAVRDGKNNKPLHSVVEWDGRGAPASCAFEGQYALDKAFNGKWSRNLRDLIAGEYPHLIYDDEDIWGYCDGSEPKVVIPVTRQVASRQRTVLRPAGVLVVQGREGHVRLSHRSRVSAGELPGPAYPITLVAKQRQMSAWAAGERFHNRGGFGFEPTTATTQLGNASDFLLRSRADGRIYRVSPLVSRGSDSQQFVAYSVMPADEVADGRLNTQRIYVLDDNDPRIVTLTRMENRIKTYLSADPGFYPAGGRVVEFLPLDAANWQAYGEVNGTVKYVFTVPVDETKRITVLNVADGQPVADAGAASPCADFTKATREQLRECAFKALEEDRRRAGESPAPAPSPSPSG
ncbi:hypothetical protein Val02_11500 [Virgisporangium aliadipatigenens]|uniref:Uncharacterized protein n=1 Tax=Virgisporangium aliadipatigenens TaxID=741659 RepID=A0A8J3YFK1_9ACTN|nr:hypothetical protein [Virgisporangium aliadipatigenens]GIJ44264.1 hypothetical protein Val02_11500 [Virgisporangium aliadipatigenens]